MLKYIIFDFDGTLADSKELSISIYNRLADKYKVKKLEEKDVNYLKNLPILERFRILNFPLYKIPLWTTEFYSMYRNSLEELCFFDGIKELIERLHNCGYSLAVISSNSEHNIRDFFRKNNINYIQKIFCSNEIFGKDRVIKKFMRNHNLKNSEVIYVGDEERDVQACKKTHIKIIWVNWGLDVVDLIKPEKPDYIANTPEDILHTILSQ